MVAIATDEMAGSEACIAGNSQRPCCMPAASVADAVDIDVGCIARQSAPFHCGSTMNKTMAKVQVPKCSVLACNASFEAGWIQRIVQHGKRRFDNSRSPSCMSSASAVVAVAARSFDSFHSMPTTKTVSESATDQMNCLEKGEADKSSSPPNRLTAAFEAAFAVARRIGSFHWRPTMKMTATAAGAATAATGRLIVFE